MKMSHAKSSKEKEPENLWSVRFDQRLLWDENVCETKCPGMARHRHARRDRRLYTLWSGEATTYITIISQNQPTDRDVKPNHVISFCKTSNIPRAKLLQTSPWRLWEEGLVWAEAFKQPGFCENKSSAAETICLFVPLQMFLYMRWLWNDTLYTTSLAEVEVCHWLKEKEDEDKSTSSRCHLKGHRRWCYPLYLYSGLPDLPIPRYGSPFNALQQGPGSRSFRFHGQDREWCCLPIYLGPLNYRGANASNARTQVILDNQSDETQSSLTQARFIAFQNLGPQQLFPGLWYPLNYICYVMTMPKAGLVGIQTKYFK